MTFCTQLGEIMSCRTRLQIFLIGLFFIAFAWGLKTASACENPTCWNDKFCPKCLEVEYPTDDEMIHKNFPFAPNSEDTLELIQMMKKTGMISDEKDVYFDENNYFHVKFSQEFLSKFECGKKKLIKKTSNCWIDTRCHGGVCCEENRIASDEESTQRCKEIVSEIGDNLSTCVGC
jgi:hypothetical protein